MTSFSVGHIILTPSQPVGSGRPQRGSNPGPPDQESRALPTELPRPPAAAVVVMVVVVVIVVVVVVVAVVAVVAAVVIAVAVSAVVTIVIGETPCVEVVT